MSNQVEHPAHYQHPSGVEAIDICEHLGFNLGNAYKYLARAGKKGDAATDLRKAAWYLRREADRFDKAGRGADKITVHQDHREMARKVLVHGADTMACRRFLVALIDGTIDEAMTKHLAEMCKAEADALPAATAGA
jgi:hypothetical protein